MCRQICLWHKTARAPTNQIRHASDRCAMRRTLGENVSVLAAAHEQDRVGGRCSGISRLHIRCSNNLGRAKTTGRYVPFSSAGDVLCSFDEAQPLGTITHQQIAFAPSDRQQRSTSRTRRLTRFRFFRCLMLNPCARAWLQLFRS